MEAAVFEMSDMGNLQRPPFEARSLLERPDRPPVIKALTVSYSDMMGGASIAAYRLHCALQRCGGDSQMLVARKLSADPSVTESFGRLSAFYKVLRPRVDGRINRLRRTGNVNLHSASLLPSNLSRQINGSDADLAHLHWICGEMMSVEDVGRIRKPVVWTLHDMWAFCGAEHYTENDRWREGYRRFNRPDYESNFDLNRWVWNRKRKAWKTPVTVVAPSKWLADCAQSSALMSSWPVKVIPNALDTEVWKPLERGIARSLLNLPNDKAMLLFGAWGGVGDLRKGWDLLLAALQHLRGRFNGLELVVFGQSQPKRTPDLGFPIHWIGHLHDDLSLRVLYNAADAILIPSRQDNLPNTGLEALACGRPVVAFDTCGLPDIVTHRQTGWLAKAFDSEDFSEGIRWVLDNPTRHAQLCENARVDAVARFSYPVIAEQHRMVYESILKRHGQKRAPKSH